MQVRYDEAVDAAYIELSSRGPQGGVEVGEGVILHVTRDDEIVAIEILGASNRFAIRNLSSLSGSLSCRTGVKEGHMQQQRGRVVAFVDWENIRRRLADNYLAKVPIDKVLMAIEKVANDIGRLQECVVFGDWSLRRDEAQLIQQQPRFRPHLVLRSGKRDQTDPVMIAEVFEAVMTKDAKGIDHILVCAGDSDYADVVRRGLIRDAKMYVCAVGKDVSNELTALAPFYPLERYLDIELVPKQPVQLTLDTMGMVDPRTVKLIEVLNSLEKKLPYVSFLYFRDKIMPIYQQLAEQRHQFLRAAEEAGIVKTFQKENPVRPGNLFRCISLDTENDQVKQVLNPPGKP